ncbi:unnamed protein product, partial [Ectocarpus sp. 12 AP-2014]
MFFVPTPPFFFQPCSTARQKKAPVSHKRAHSAVQPSGATREESSGTKRKGQQDPPSTVLPQTAKVRTCGVDPGTLCAPQTGGEITSLRDETHAATPVKVGAWPDER